MHFRILACLAVIVSAVAMFQGCLLFGLALSTHRSALFRFPRRKPRREELQDGPQAQLERLPGTHLTRSAALCLVTNDPHLRYIDEWADFHFALGFTHLMLFDNSKNFTLKNWGGNKWYADRIIVKEHFLPGLTHSIPDKGDSMNNQDFVYMQCVNEAKRRGIHWVAAIDSDEFLVISPRSSKIDLKGITIQTSQNQSQNTYLNVLDFLDEYCPRNSACSQLSLNWMEFFPSGHERYVPVPVTRRFQYRGSKPQSWVRAIVDPTAVDTARMFLHTFSLFDGREWWDTSGNVIKTHGKRWNYMHNFRKTLMLRFCTITA